MDVYPKYSISMRITSSHRIAIAVSHIWYQGARHREWERRFLQRLELDNQKPWGCSASSCATLVGCHFWFRAECYTQDLTDWHQDVSITLLEHIYIYIYYINTYTHETWFGWFGRLVQSPSLTLDSCTVTCPCSILFQTFFKSISSKWSVK